MRLIADLRAHGGELVLGEPVTTPPDGVAIYDTAPTALLNIYGDAVPDRYAKALRRYRFGPGVCKVDFVLSGEIPWRDERVGQAPTVHMGGSRAQMALAEREIAAGRHAEWPMTLASLPHLADPSRVDDQGRRPLWTYSHVPAGSTSDVTETVTAMFERAAPGFRDLVVATRSVPAARMSDHNANYVGGDIIVGGATLFGGDGRPDAAARPVDHTHPQGVPLLVGDATGHGSARHGGLLRRTHGAASRVRNQDTSATLALTHAT